MNILHISRMNFTSNKAHVYTTAKTCEAFSMQDNVKVTLLSCDNSLLDEKAKQEFFEKHQIKHQFNLISLNALSNLFKKSKWRILNWIETILSNFSIANFIVRNHSDFDILYYRDCSLFIPILIFKYLYRKPIFIEIHAVLHKKHGQILNNFFAKISNGLIVITYGLKKYYEVFNSKIIVSFCAAAESEKFDEIVEDKEKLRQKLNLPLDKIILMYSGNLAFTGNFDSYGIEDIINAIALMDKRIIFVCIGKKGNETVEHELLVLRLGIKDRVLFLPWMNRRLLYQYWKASDVLMHPAAGAQIGNSPTKIFEYLAAGKPIISAGTEPIKEILINNYNSLLVDNYKDPRGWVEAVKILIKDHDITNRIIDNAKLDSKKYTWLNRGHSIVSFIELYK